MTKHSAACGNSTAGAKNCCKDLRLSGDEPTCDGAGSDVNVEGDAAGRAAIDAILQRQLDLSAQRLGWGLCYGEGRNLGSTRLFSAHAWQRDQCFRDAFPITEMQQTMTNTACRTSDTTKAVCAAHNMLRMLCATHSRELVGDIDERHVKRILDEVLIQSLQQRRPPETKAKVSREFAHEGIETHHGSAVDSSLGHGAERHGGQPNQRVRPHGALVVQHHLPTQQLSS